MHSLGNARKPQIWPVSLNQNNAKITTINRPWPGTNQFWRWSRYISMQNFRPFLPMPSPGNARKPQIWPVSLSQNSAKITTINRPWPGTNQFWRWSRYISMQNFRPFLPMPSPGNARKPQIWPVSLSQNSAKITKINRLWPRTYQFWRWSRYISVQNVRPVSPCVLWEMPWNPKFDPFH